MCTDYNYSKPINSYYDNHIYQAFMVFILYLDHRRRHLGSHGHHCVPFDAQGLSKGNPSLRTAWDHFSFSL